jgi:hypothetical protein
MRQDEICHVSFADFNVNCFHPRLLIIEQGERLGRTTAFIFPNDSRSVAQRFAAAIRQPPCEQPASLTLDWVADRGSVVNRDRAAGTRPPRA